MRALLCALLLACALPAIAQGLDYRLQPRQVAPGVHVIEGAVEDFSRANGCNIINTGFIVGARGVVVINTGPSRLYGEQMRQAIARVTPLPVLRVLNLNLHPDYFFGNQAFEAPTLAATPATVAGIKAEGKAYEDNLYRLCGDWMTGTERREPQPLLSPGVLDLGDRQLELLELSGHTASDMVVIDRATGTVFAGGLVFLDRVPTTPHADIPRWLASLDALQKLDAKLWVPSHGRVASDTAGIEQTRAYLRWLDDSLRRAARRGADMIDVLEQPVPPAFRALGAFRTEYVRNVSHLYPRYEREVLGGAR